MDMGLSAAYRPRCAARDARRRTNSAIAALNGLWRGSLTDVDLLPRERRDSSWESATPMQRRIVGGIMRSYIDNDLGDEAARGEDAFRRATKTFSDPYTGPGGEAEGSSCLARGSVCPLVLDELSMPPPGVTPIDPTLHSEAVKHYYHLAEQMMLRNPASIDWEEYRKLKPYSDPALKNKTLLGLLVRFWDANMLGFTDQSKEHVTIFAVVKTDVIDEQGRRKRRSRVVWGERRPNMLFNAPPKLPLGSAFSFSHFDASAEAIGAERTLLSFTGDLPDWFYRVLLPAALHLYTSPSRASPARSSPRTSAGPGAFRPTPWAPTFAFRCSRWGGAGRPSWRTRSP